MFLNLAAHAQSATFRDASHDVAIFFLCTNAFRAAIPRESSSQQRVERAARGRASGQMKAVRQIRTVRRAPPRSIAISSEPAGAELNRSRTSSMADGSTCLPSISTSTSPFSRP